ncbi:MAG: RNase P subunit p30 family protein [Candidatus Bathyarchaeales archaeon]
MKKAFADLHLCPNLKEFEQTARLVGKAAVLGYRLIAVAFQANSKAEEIEKVKGICQENGIDLATRVDLKPRTPKELIGFLRRVRRRFEVVAVVCDSKNVSRQAAKDHRVDLLNFPSYDFRKRFFDMAEAELASKASAALEIDMKPLLTLEGAARVRLLSILRREAALAKNFHVPVVVSSGVQNEFLMRKPRELASLTQLFDLDMAEALNAVSKTPLAIVKRNREKLSPSFVAPGIRIVRRGKDC